MNPYYDIIDNSGIGGATTATGTASTTTSASTNTTAGTSTTINGINGTIYIPVENPPKDDKPLTFDDLLKDKAFQAEFDRRMSKGIETALANERKRHEQIIDDKISEAEKLSKMTDLERKEYQQKKEAEDLVKREADLNRRELMAEAKATLAEKGLPIELANILDYSNADAVKASLATVTETYSGAVQAGVDARLKGGKPPTNATNNSTDEEQALNKNIYDSMKGAF